MALLKVVIKLELNFKVTNQRLEKCNDNFIVAKSHKYLKIFFDFTTEDWDDLSKFVILKNSKREAYMFDYSPEGIIVPSVVLDGNQFGVSVYGGDETAKRITTNEVGVLVTKTGYTEHINSITDEDVDVFIEVRRLLNTKFDTVDFTGGIVTFSNDVGDTLGTVDISTHTGNEIKASYRQLANRIRTTSANAEP